MWLQIAHGTQALLSYFNNVYYKSLLQKGKQLFLSSSAPQRRSPPLTRQLSLRKNVTFFQFLYWTLTTLVPFFPPLPCPRAFHLCSETPITDPLPPLNPNFSTTKDPPYIRSWSTQGTMSFFHPCPPWQFTPFWGTPCPQAHRPWGRVVSSQISISICLISLHISEASCFVNIKYYKINNHLHWSI